MLKPILATRAGTKGHGKFILFHRGKSGMEEIHISKEQEQKLLSLFKKRVNIGMAFIIVGLIFAVPTIIILFSDVGDSYFTSGAFIFPIIVVIYWVK